MPWVGELIQIKEDNKNKSMPGRVVGEVMNEMRNECVLHSFTPLPFVLLPFMLHLPHEPL